MNGLNVPVGDKFHCIAAEPHTTFVRISVANGRKDIGFDSMVLGRLRCGYRVFQMRSWFGTRIELCYLFARIHVGKEKNFWTTPRQVHAPALRDPPHHRCSDRVFCAQVRLAHERKVEMLEENIEELKKQNSALQNSALLLRSGSAQLEESEVSVGL